MFSQKYDQQLFNYLLIKPSIKRQLKLLKGQYSKRVTKKKIIL
jgi:hypothetical protein